MITVKFTKTHPHAVLPTKGSPDAAGWDLYTPTDVFLGPGTAKLVLVGLKIAIPRGYEAQVRPRSGLALKKNITVLNSPGTIDADYRGELGALLICHGTWAELKRGDRIAQLVIQPVLDVRMELVDELDTTERGEGGFGSTGE